MVKVSIIVPIYNVHDYIGACLESLLNQTLQHIEIICIDDASTDGSLDIVKEKTDLDNRIKIILHDKNRGTAQARKHGVELAQGEYILFVDGDDTLNERACEKLYNRIKKENVDILHYGTEVIPATALSKTMIDWVENFLNPYPQKLYGKSILEKCYVEEKFDFNITDKMWNSKLCKKAFSQLNNQRMISAEDQYAFFILAFYAKSYLGVQEEKFYNYNLGIGITGGDLLDLERFEKRCTGVLATQAVKIFLEKEKKFKEYQKVYQCFYNKILWDCVDCWINKLSLKDSDEGYSTLLKYWNSSEVVAAIARTNFEDESFIKEKIHSFYGNDKKIVGIYCKEISSEIERKIIEKEKSLLEEEGNEVLLFIDQGSTFTIDSAILLPESKLANWDKYKNRAEKIQELMEKYNINILIYMSPESHIAWLDELLLKSCGVATMTVDFKSNLFAVEEVSMLKKKKVWKRKLRMLIGEK